MELIMKEQKYLFIGGPADGQWFDTDGRQNWIVHAPKCVPELVVNQEYCHELTGETCEYVAHRLCWKGDLRADEHMVYAPRGKDLDVIALLIKGYAGVDK